MNSMPFRQLKSFLKILIGVQYNSSLSGTAGREIKNLHLKGEDNK